MARLREMLPGARGPVVLEHVRALFWPGRQQWLEVSFTLHTKPKHVIEPFGMAVFNHAGWLYGYAVFSEIGSSSIIVHFQPAP